MNPKLPVAIIGGGPVGLAAAAQLINRNEPFILFEAGKHVGTHFLHYQHVRLFSPWIYNIDLAAKKLLQKHHVPLSLDDELPLGEEMVSKYFTPLAELPELKPYIHLESRVVSIGRKGFDKVKTAGRKQVPFVIKVKHNEKEEEEEETYEAKAVIDATGTWQYQNPIGAGGIFASGEKEAYQQIYYGLPDVLNRDRKRYENKTVAVVGSGHSAINTLLDLVQLQKQTETTKIIWILRKKQVNEVFGGGDKDQLPARGELGTRLRQAIEYGSIHVYSSMYIHSISSLKQDKLKIEGKRDGQLETIDEIEEIISSTGSRPNFEFLREIRYAMDPALECVPKLADLIDPNHHSCGTVCPHGEQELKQPEQNFYIIGSKSYGRAPTFLLATGYEQARSVVASIAGDQEAAKRLELNLPETGVCKATSSILSKDIKPANSSCCS